MPSLRQLWLFRLTNQWSAVFYFHLLVSDQCAQYLNRKVTIKQEDTGEILLNF